MTFEEFLANFCTNCGKEIQKDDKFCGNCGVRINLQEPRVVPRAILDSKIEEIQNLEFFRWFHLEKEYEKIQEDTKVAVFRPSGDNFHNLVSLTASAAHDTSVVYSALLILSNSFISSRQSAAFAGDIASSFLRSVVPSDLLESERLAHLAQEIQYRSTFSNKDKPVLTRDDSKKIHAILDSTPSEWYRIYVGERGPHREEFHEYALEFGNAESMSIAVSRLKMYNASSPENVL